MSPAELVAALIEQGFQPPEELQQKADASLSDEAYHYLSEKVIVKLSDEDDNAKNRKARNEVCTDGQVRNFEIAEWMYANYRAENKAVGRGHQIERFSSVKTPRGTLVLRLREDMPEEKSTEESK